MKILITGAAGMLGRDLVPALAAHEAVAGVDRPDGDLADPATAPRLLATHRPDWVVNCAAYTAVDSAEDEPEKAAAANATAVRCLAEACAAAGVRLLHISTDYVFDGRKAEPYLPADPTGPVSAYGRTKLAGERAALAAGGATAILRTAWLHGPHGPNFVAAILRQLDAGRPLRVVDDQVGAPTYTAHFAQAVAAAIAADLRGVHHATAGGACTWFGLAHAICELTGRRGHPLTPISSDELARPAPRPANSRLDMTSFVAATGFVMPPWRDGLAAHLARLGRLAEDR
jgi:dTDP-4-dehydrorhamnose reductase